MDVCWNNKIQRKYKEPKKENKQKQKTKQNENCVHAQLGQIMDNRIQKDQNNPNATSEESVAKTDCQEQKHMPSVLNANKGMGKSPKPPL